MLFLKRMLSCDDVADWTDRWTWGDWRWQLRPTTEQNKRERATKLPFLWQLLAHYSYIIARVWQTGIHNCVWNDKNPFLHPPALIQNITSVIIWRQVDDQWVLLFCSKCREPSTKNVFPFSCLISRYRAVKWNAALKTLPSFCRNKQPQLLSVHNQFSTYIQNFTF